jgi:uncharacterized Fe-S center protein
MTVYFIPWDPSQNLMENAGLLYDKAGTFNCVEKGDLVAIKLHVGELGNPNHVHPFLVHDVIRKVIDKGGKPFLTDSTTYYQGQRNNAYDHMLNALKHGFGTTPFIIADGLRGENSIKVKTKGILNEIEVAGVIAQADSMIVTTHDKGHDLAGFGGAIKNLAMGCTSQAGKLRQHRTVGIEIDESKCVGCGKCKEVCAMHLPEIIGGKARILSARCMRCPFCRDSCPEGAIKLLHQNDFLKALASAAYGVLSTFKSDKISYVSFAKDITPHCDCRPDPGLPLMKDIGIFASNSPVSIDGAFLQMAKYKIFNETYKVDCVLQLEEAAKLGIKGDIKPKIEKVRTESS